VLSTLLFCLWLPASATVPQPDAAQTATLDQRVEALQRRLEHTKSGTPEAFALSRSFTEIGAEYLELGDPGQATELLKQAYSLDPQNGLALAELTLAYVRQQDYEFARFYLHLAEERAASSPPAIYRVLGDIYYAMNQLDDAIASWEHYDQLGGQDRRTREMLERARREAALSPEQRVLRTERFTIYYAPAIPESHVETIAASLKEKYRQESAYFGVDLPDTQVVILYAGRAYFSLVSVPDWVSGVFDGKIRVAVDPYAPLPAALFPILAHELAHAFVRHVSADRAPGWLHEGIAQWWEGRRMHRREIRKAVEGHAYALSQMEGNLARKTTVASARAAYAEALGLTEYIIFHHGTRAPACIVSDLGRGMSVEQALQRETGLEPETLLARWRAWVGF
jgi:tetratricopeptide (TPR) repeat protein